MERHFLHKDHAACINIRRAIIAEMQATRRLYDTQNQACWL
jgi:hypothetical protein